MKCAAHLETDAVGYCSQCGKGLCAACRREVRGVLYCEDCLAARVTAAPAAPGAPSPGVALGLGFIPGVGAIYNGELMKGLIHILIFGSLVSALGSGAARGLEPLLGMMTAAFYFYMPFEAYQTAKRRAAGWQTASGGGEPLAFSNGGRTAPVGPLILIVLGVLFLLNTLDIIDWTWQIGRFWPVILIVLGVWMLLKRRAGSSESAANKESKP